MVGRRQPRLSGVRPVVSDTQPSKSAIAKLKENNVTLRRRATVVLALSLMAWVVCAKIAPAAAQPACV